MFVSGLSPVGGDWLVVFELGKEVEVGGLDVVVSVTASVVMTSVVVGMAVVVSAILELFTFTVELLPPDNKKSTY